MDTALFFAVNRGMSNMLFDVLMPALSAGGYFLFFPYAAYILWQGWHTADARGRACRKSAILAVVMAAGAFSLADWTSDLLKHAIARTRPCHVLEGVRLLVGCTKSYAMPSGHAMTSFAAAVPLFQMAGGHVPLPWRLYPLGLASAVAFSRVYVGVHYPSDVVVGALMGGVVALALMGAFHQLERYGGKRPGPDRASEG